MKCKHCGKLFNEHGCMNQGCPMFDENGLITGFTKEQTFEPEEKKIASN